MKICKHLILLLILSVNVFAAVPFDILPFDAHNITPDHLKEFHRALATAFEKTGKYAPGLTADVAEKLHSKYLTAEDLKNQSWDTNRQLLDLCRKAGLQRLISGRLSFNGTTYTILLKIYDLKLDQLVFDETLYHYTTFDQLIHYDLAEMIANTVNPPAPKMRGWTVSVSLQPLLAQQSTVYSPVLSGGWNTENNLSLNLSAGLPAGKSPWFATITLEKILRKYMALSGGFSYFSEQDDNFDFLSLYNAPDINKITDLSHGPGIFLGAGLKIPLTPVLTLSAGCNSDVFYCEWHTADDLKKTGWLYQLRWTFSIQYLFPVKSADPLTF